ncbi:MAG: type II toxin-antitoxin system Phd/YefM family antitoxin [Solirubrobacterales bacterium]|jgi:prevent-host-death family protein
MSDVGVRDLKRHLSEYLGRAERGEVITVTDRGRPKAILSPLPGRLRLEEGIEGGWVRPAHRSGLRPVPRASAERSVADALAEDRGE